MLWGHWPQVREGARRIARLESALAEARTRNPTPTATSPTRAGGPREARLTNELQARSCLQTCSAHDAMRCAVRSRGGR